MLSIILKKFCKWYNVKKNQTETINYTKYMMQFCYMYVERPEK